MTLLKRILSSIFICAMVLSETVEITVYSDSFTIDTVYPEIDLLEPGHGDVYQHGEIIEVSWIGSDESPSPYPVTINATPYLNSEYHEIATDISNSGSYNLPAPDFINSMFVSIRLDFKDYYGNVSSSHSEGYFTIGTPNEDQYETDTFTGEFTSSNFTIDTNPPNVTWIYPNESTNFEPSQQLVVRWESSDENLSSNPIDLFFTIDAGNMEFILDENILNTGLKFITLPDTTTQFGQFTISSTDSYGNVSTDISDSYMSIGNEETDDLDQITTDVTAYSSSFIVDTKIPVFIQLDEEDKVFSNTEYEAAKIISSDKIDSMDNYINEIKLFIECCEEKENKEEDINCNGFYRNNMIGYWDEREIIKLDSIKSVYSENNLERYTKTFNTIVEINEVYDSIAVGIIKNYNNNSCIKLRPGDILTPVK